MTRDKFTCLMARVQLILSDLIISFMWVWSCGLTKILLYNYLALGQPIREIMEGSLYVLSIFFFSWLGNNCSGGSYNPFSVSVLSDAISGDNARYWFAVGVRVPTQAIGSTIAVKLIIWAFPEIDHDAILNVDIFRGALVEGALTYLIVVISLEASENHNNNFFLETWISSVCELALHILGHGMGLCSI
ncbi:PREDICTED: probable aquaporin SIP2-1 isoform X2 [Nelumbo nucifera]|uniref:Probable aquaporin SIP2-1 isoform X2 n=1 Tax=Nelumbo nucifera TaxID=4432 RepID=A0A1U7ZSE5_NELNU|nr:PREDICTED: probable aquaporin SIP2-1 isoform X2 [Nelumbo nucifera]